MGSPSSPYAGESASLRARLSGTLLAWRVRDPGFEWVRIDLSRGERTLRAAPRVWTFSEPDAQGRFFMGTLAGNENTREQRLERLHPDGKREVLARSRWAEREFAREVTLSPDGLRLAFLQSPTPLPGAAAPRGTRTAFHLSLLEIGNEPRPLLPGRFIPSGLVGSNMSWFPDSRHLAVVVQGPRGLELGAPSLASEEPDAQVLVVDTHTGSARVIGPGRQVWVSSDGASLLIRQHEVPPDLPAAQARRRQAWALRPNDLVRLPVDPHGQVGPQQTPIQAPADITAVLAWLQDRYLVYRAEVTPGAPSGLTTGNSPLVGPKPLQAVKVLDTHNGEFLTVLEGVDPRATLAVR